MATLWLDIEDEQDWKLNNHKWHPPEIVGNGGWGVLMNKQPQMDWSGTGWSKGRLKEGCNDCNRRGEGVGGCRNSLHFLLVWPDGTIVDCHADNWDWKLVAGINYRLENIAFFSHPSNFGGCSEKRNRKIFLFLFWAIARDKSSSTSHTGETPKKQLAEMRRGLRGVCDLAQRARADPKKL